jgi:23S rRNA (pseudouridine1915-N3)-methyltransferase
VVIFMLLTLASISPRTKSKSEPTTQLVDEYILRATRFNPTDTATFPTEHALLDALDARPRSLLLLLDSRGDLQTSEQFAATIGTFRDNGTQRLLLAIGPADGWTPTAHARAAKTLSLGRMTMPHELARAVLAEQLYRALTILARHPYHSGH